MAVELRGLTLASDTRRLLEEVTLELAPGQVHGVTGRNGAGKSAVIAGLAGLLRPTSGTVHLLGAPPHPLRGRVGLLLQEEDPYPQQRVSEYLNEYAKSVGATGQRHLDSAMELLRLLSPLPLWSAPLHRLHPGGRRAVAVARALLGEPPLLLLDEPFAPLDGVARRRLADHLRALAGAGRTVVVTSNCLTALCACATTCWLLRDRALVAAAAEVADLEAGLAEAGT